jgi:hypothetical protein
MSMSAAVLSSVSAIPTQLESDVIAELARWIPEQVAKRATRFVLAQRVGESAHQTVNEWATAADLEDPHALAVTIYEIAEHETQALKTAVTYGVFAIRADRPEPVARKYFRVDAGLGWMQPTDAPDERGVTAMLMRHTEASARLSLGHSRGILDQYERLQELTVAHTTRLLDQANARVAILEAREMEALQLRDQLQSMSRQRELELAQLTQGSQMKIVAMEKLTQLAPLILAKLGRGDAPLSPAANMVGAMEVLEQLIVSLQPEQFTKLAAILRPEQLAMLSHLYDVVDARNRPPPGAAPAAAAPPENPSPEASPPPEKP